MTNVRESVKGENETSHEDTMTIGFGIIGCGMISNFHARAIADAEGAQLIGVADRIPEPAATFAETHGCTAYESVDAMLAAPSDLPNQDKWFGPYLKAQGNAVPKDPWGSEYVYEYPGKNNEQDLPDIWSIGPDRQDGTDDDVGNWMVEE